MDFPEDLSIDDPLFYTHAFTHACQKRKQAYIREADNFKRVAAEEYNDLSLRLDLSKFQESTSVRNVLRTRRLANLLIDDNGDLNTAVLPRIIDLFENSLYSLGPNRQFDTYRQQHLLKVLKLLKENKNLVRMLQNIDKPVSHKYAEQMIRDSLALPPNTPITHAHTRRAVLSAWLCTLRQNVGSCFATAPAIIVQSEQPELFLKDMAELLNTGRLKRTFGGIEYTVPLSPSWGAGDLKKKIPLYLGEVLEDSGVWLSPGLIAAFEAAELIDPELHNGEIFAASKKLVIDALSELRQPFVLISAEEIIRIVLLHHLKLTEKDLLDYQNKPKEMLQTSLVMHVPSKETQKSSKSAAYNSFINKFAAACSAFKGIADNALLKAWEFSLASFAETKAQFTRWNLYSSLGLNANDTGGIGPTLYAIVKEKVEEANRKVHDLQYEYEAAFHQLKTMEARMKSVQSESEAQWLKSDYQVKRNEFYTLEEMRHDYHEKAQRFANLYKDLVEKYDALFPEYFQEIYDADMHEITTGPYDDSPAGFRLLYKYGRSNTSQWTLIKSPEEFIDALSSFFTSTENGITASDEFKGMEREISDIITAVVNQVKTKEFLETAFYRIAAAHNAPMIKNPLEHLDRIEKKPWAYTSGGTMGTLVSCYFKLEGKPAEAARWVENPTELFVFLIDTLKQIPPKRMEEFLRNPDKSMLMHSPTHAFLLKPGLSPYKEAWQSDGLTYIWVRDNIIIPREDFVNNLWLDPQKMHYLIEQLKMSVPENFRYYFTKVFGNIREQMRPKEFREYILDTIQKEKGLRHAGKGILTSEEIDSSLYTHLPLFHRDEWRERTENIFKAIPQISEKDRTQLMQVFDTVRPSFSQELIISANTLQEVCMALICLTLQITSSPIDYRSLITNAARSLGYAMPAPILFADTNWVKDYFGFVFNPGSGRFDLWRSDILGRIASPMSAWEQWLDGSRKDITWGVYTKSYEYAS